MELKQAAIPYLLYRFTKLPGGLLVNKSSICTKLFFVDTRFIVVSCSENSN